MQVESMYQEIILDHYKNPQGKGLREPFNGEAHHVNPSCGDEITVRVKLSPEKAIFIFVDEVLPPTAALMSSIYEEHKDEDGFLYITYVMHFPLFISSYTDAKQLLG